MTHGPISRLFGPAAALTVVVMFGSGASAAPSPSPSGATVSGGAASSPAPGAGTPIPLEFGCAATVARCQDLPPGTYATAGQWAFLRGMTVTLPAGWSSSEQDSGEFNLHRVDDPMQDDVLFFWRDMAATLDSGQLVPGVGRTADDLVAFLSHDSRLIASAPERVTIGDGIPATSIVISVASGATTAPPSPGIGDCPGDACAGPLTDPKHWEGTFGITINSEEDPGLACPCSHAVRLYFATIGSEADPHTFVVAVSVYAPDPVAELARFQAKVQPILDSVRVPAVVVDN